MASISQFFGSIPAPVAASLIAALVAVLVATLIFRWQKSFEAKLALKREKRELLRFFLQQVEVILSMAKPENWQTSEPVVRLYGLQAEIEFLADQEVTDRSASVVSAVIERWNRDAGTETLTYDRKSMSPYEAIIYARKDLVRLMKKEVAL